MSRNLWGPIDWERVALVPVMLLLLVGSSARLLSISTTTTDSPHVDVLELGHQILLVAFYVLIVVLLLVRHDPIATSDQLLPRLLAYVATFLPFLLPFAEGPLTTPRLAITAVGLQAAGMAFSVYSLAVLGRSFGVEPKVRRLVTSGPYRFIRHPLYVGEVLALTGAVLFAPSWVSLGILLALVALQTYRALQEEQLLESTLPEYAEYRSRTRMFVPGVV